MTQPLQTKQGTSQSVSHLSQACGWSCRLFKASTIDCIYAAVTIASALVPPTEVPPPRELIPVVSSVTLPAYKKSLVSGEPDQAPLSFLDPFAAACYT
ncbi:MAG: hypothetical protein LBV53_01300 [Mycoplasmataceae bacterium]|nr:hypothetical protein [Mycoplasmataceae bacterium]